MTSTFYVSAIEKSDWQRRLRDAQLQWRKYSQRSIASRLKVGCKKPIDATRADHDSGSNKCLLEAYNDLLVATDGKYV